MTDRVHRPPPTPMQIDRYRVRPGDRTILKRLRPGDTSPLRDKDAAEGRLRQIVAHLDDRLELLNAENRRSLLLIFQGMDASGRTVRSSMSSRA